MPKIPESSDRPTLPLWPDTGQAMGLSRNACYMAAARGDIPTIRIGGRILVPTAALRRLLCLDAPDVVLSDVGASHAENS